MYDVICIGGGLAGLTASIHLKKEGFRVLVLEKEAYPHHKVCGEYLSKEILPYLRELGVDLSGAVEIDTLEFSTAKGRRLELELPLGALGISRFKLDHTLYLRALSLKVEILFGTVTSVDFDGHSFCVRTQTGETYYSTYVLGTYGKRSGIDHYLDRPFIKGNSPWLAVKAHYHYPDFSSNLVGLHSFDGGYGGLSMTETGAINFCYLVSYKHFQKVRDIEQFNKKTVSRNPRLRHFLEHAEMLFERPLTIAQVSFASKKPVESHVLMCGDTAGLIHPLCGNGMAMAIHSAKLASELLCGQLGSKNPDRTLLEKEYSVLWRRTFGRRVRTGRYLQRLLLSATATDLLFTLASESPGTLRRIIRRTHGNPVAI
ncbi:NAD(P)/FAD-dependent oxidoreductase [Muriicola marianensis]|uniref:FAD-dependent oxidoreductase n=1 Tax=Muriicola marianensis TaxID=1324801 RepID=A0ABQ1QPA7_9FLAO|nr:NAD(P)/FAD-dependent oxidoreductase [Muriicola marianensis]GGD39341.1 FAD-dependent oxidoreductase [Muriicola marianensis]